MNNSDETLINELQRIKKFQDGFLDDPEKAEKTLSLLPSHDGWAGYEYKDVLILQRQRAYREGFESGYRFFKKKLNSSEHSVESEQ